MAESRFYNYKRIMRQKALYRMIIGQRSNGKTFGWCRMALEHYFRDGLHSAYIRRLDTMIERSTLSSLFDPHLEWIKKKSNGQWNRVVYISHAFYLARFEETKTGDYVKVSQDVRPFCRTYAINTWETTKGQDAGKVWSICFDEFITRRFYIANEFVCFQNLLSSIMRGRPCEIFMLANTVNKSCIYFKEMGIKHIREMAQGELDLYHIGQTDKMIAVEYSDAPGDAEKVSDFFAFDNPELRMITSGAWEISMYRHAPFEMERRGRLIQSFFIEHEGQILQGDIRLYDRYPIIYIHPKTTPYKDEGRARAKEIVYVDDQIDGNPLHQISLRIAPTRAHELIRSLIAQRKTFFSDNECGEMFANWAQNVQGIAREAI